jgi:hypothetical protein
MINRASENRPHAPKWKIGIRRSFRQQKHTIKKGTRYQTSSSMAEHRSEPRHQEALGTSRSGPTHTDFVETGLPLCLGLKIPSGSLAVSRTPLAALNRGGGGGGGQGIGGGGAGGGGGGGGCGVGLKTLGPAVCFFFVVFCTY